MGDIFQQQHPQNLLEACLVREVDSNEDNHKIVAYANTLNPNFALPCH